MGDEVRVLTGSESKGAGSSKWKRYSDKVDIVEMGKTAKPPAKGQEYL